MKSENRKQADVAAAAGVAPSTIYRLIEGVVRPDHSTLPRILQAATDNLALRYEIILGHIMDEVMASGLPISGLVLRRSDEKELTAPPAIAAEVRLILDCASIDQDFADIVRDLAPLAARISARLVDLGRYPEVDYNILQVAENASRKAPRKNGAAPTARQSFPPRSKAS